MKSQKVSTEAAQQAFLDYLAHYYPFSEAQRQLIGEKLIHRQIPKKHKLVDLGQVAKEIYFIHQGCLRLYYVKPNGDEVTGFFFTENMTASSLESFISQQPSIQVIESLEECQLMILNRPSLEELFETVPETHIMMRKVLEERFINAQKVVASFVLMNAEERYEQMLRQQPEILNRVPQHTLATYL
jgi:CRP-like cAMP-binding protein